MTLARMLVSIVLLGAAACDTENPTMVVVDNGYAPVPDGGDPKTQMTVFKVWWVTSLLPDAVGPGGEGQPQRTVPNTDFAYALIAPGWDPSSPMPPTTFVAARSTVRLTATRGDTLRVHVSDNTFVGNCAVGMPLSQDDASFITQLIFPAEFAGSSYDAATCVATGSSADAGVDATGDASSQGSSDAEAQSDGEGEAFE
ncbi:MAG: hypothetical protein M3O46_10165 [Myxococcota bacterium]|nr:hypothetical protein [Myxococcota bacterium]